MTTTEHKEIVQKINTGFENDDVEAILSCLADDVRWYVVGAFTANGKEAFRDQIHNENFPDAPTINIINEIAEGNYVAVEGAVQNLKIDGTLFTALFHNTYRFEDGKVKSMTSYVVPV